MSEETLVVTKEPISTPKQKPMVFYAVIVLLLIGMTFGVFIYMQYIKNQVDQRLQGFSGELSTLSKTLQEQQSKLINDKTQMLFNSDQRVAWESYLNLQQADIAMHVNYDFGFALQILQKLRLISLSVPKLQPLVEQLNKDIQTIGAIKPVAYGEIYQQIENVGQRVMALPLFAKPIAPAVEKNSPNIQPQLSSQDWRQVPLQIKNYLQKMVVIQRIDGEKAVNFVNDPQAMRWLILLKLNQAQIALLQKQQSIYEQSLTAAAQLLVQTFYLNRPAVDPEIKILQDLSKITINPVIPDLNASIQLAASLVGNTNGEPKQ